MIVYQMSLYFILIIFNDLPEVSINTSVTLSFAAVLELFLQTFERFFLSRFISMSYFISYIFLQLMFLVVMEDFVYMLTKVNDLCFLKMPVNAVQYRMTVGIFNNQKLITNLRFEFPSCSKLSNNLSSYDPNYISLLFYIFLIAFLFSKGYVLKISTKLHISIFLLFNILLGVLVWLYSCLIILSGDVEVNPEPKNSVSECLSICHWNLNSISAHDYSKLFLLKAYISVQKFDIICLSETYLDSTVPLDYDNLVISGYNLIRSDHPSNTKRGSVCLYYKNYLPLRVINISY